MTRRGTEMARRTYIQDPVTLELVPIEDYVRPDPVAPMVMPDIAGYQSMADGSWIGSRSAHREHLKRHGLIEIGNERMEPRRPTVDRESIRRDVIEATRRVLG